MKKHLYILIFLYSISSLLVVSQTKSFNPLNEKSKVIWGQGFDNLGYRRFPSEVQSKIPAAVWNNSLHSSGLQIRFRTNSSKINIKYSVAAKFKGNNWFSDAGANGLDMYMRGEKNEWIWCHPNKKEIGSFFSYEHLSNEAFYKTSGKEYYLYLPIFAETKTLNIEIDSDAFLEFQPVERKAKPIVIYGTSIAHGAVASRSGNSWSNIVSRNMPEIPIINLGFSGSGKMEPEVVQVINQIDASVFILDCLPNMSNEALISQIIPRYKNAIEEIRKAHPQAAILLTEHPGYADMAIYANHKQLVENANNALKEVYKSFVKKGYKKLYYLSREDLSLDMSADFADYIHPNDKGMYQYAKVYTQKLKKILKKINRKR